MSNRILLASALGFLALSGPGRAPAAAQGPPGPSTVVITPAPISASEELMNLSKEYWEGHLRSHPTLATSIGDHRYDPLLEDNSPEGLDEETRRLEFLQDRAEMIRPETLSAAEGLTLRALRAELRSNLARLGCGFEFWNVDPLGGPQVEFFNLPSIQKLRDVESGRAMVARWHALAPYIRRHIENLKLGLADGKLATRKAVERVIEEIDDLENRPLAEWSLLAPLRDIPAEWPEKDRLEITRGLTEAAGEFRDALFDYRGFLELDVLPLARGEDRVGIGNLSGGAACYRDLIYVHTSLDLPPEEIHRIGLAEVARINAEMQALGQRVLGTDDLAQIHRRLRDDPAMHFATRDEVEAKAVEALRRAEARVPEWFGIRHRAPCQVLRMEAHEEKHSTIAYYKEPAADGSRPGTYYVNTYAPETRPRYEAEALAFHEAVPGHHLQIAVMQELTDLPEFRRYSGVTAYIEGWALYTERLADEMGLYSGDLDRIGMLSFDAWRACRLVVDTGIHALGWSRQQAIDYMMANTVLAENNIENEVDRYIAWPGQALAYKLGQREILALRAEAKERLGARFDIRAFHDAVLREGAVDLGTLRELVLAWIEETAQGK